MDRRAAILTAINASGPVLIVLLAMLSAVLQDWVFLSKALSLGMLLATVGWLLTSPVLATVALRALRQRPSASGRQANLGLLVLWGVLAFVGLGFALLFPVPRG